MDFLPPGDWVPTPSARVRRTALAAIAVVCLTLGTATVLDRLARPVAERPPGLAAVAASASGR
jgi:hypothetical protein